MTSAQLVNIIELLLLPALIALCYLFAQYEIQRLPSHLVQKLEIFSHMAVKSVLRGPEQPAQKQAAILTTIVLFKAYKLPLPSSDVLDVAIDAAFYDLAQR